MNLAVDVYRDYEETETLGGWSQQKRATDLKARALFGRCRHCETKGDRPLITNLDQLRLREGGSS